MLIYTLFLPVYMLYVCLWLGDDWELISFILAIDILLACFGRPERIASGFTRLLQDKFDICSERMIEE